MSDFFDNAMSLYNNKNYKDAVKYYKVSIEEGDNDRNIAVCYYLSMCYNYLGDSVNRLKYLFKSFEYDKPRAEICCEIGNYFIEKIDYRTAIFWLKLVLQLEKPEYSSFYIYDYWGYIPNLSLCVCYDKLNKFDLANDYNEKASEYKPDSEAVIHNKKYFHGLLADSKLEFMEHQKLIIKHNRENYKEYTNPGVTLITPTNKSEYMDNIFKTYERINYEPKELIIILNNNELSIDNYKELAEKHDNIKVFQLDESYTLGECLNFAIQNSKYDYIAKVDDDDYYGKNYLTDQMNVFNYTDADVTGKSKWFSYFEHNDTLWVTKWTPENAVTTAVAGGTILAKKEVFDKIKFHEVNFAEDKAFFNDCIKVGFKIYSNNRFNYAYIRHINLENHTWKVDTSAIENISLQIKLQGDFKDVVEI